MAATFILGSVAFLLLMVLAAAAGRFWRHDGFPLHAHALSVLCTAYGLFALGLVVLALVSVDRDPGGSDAATSLPGAGHPCERDRACASRPEPARAG